MACNTPIPNPPHKDTSSGFDANGDCPKAQMNARQRALADAIKWALTEQSECPSTCPFRSITIKFTVGPCKKTSDADPKKLEATCTWTVTVECTAKPVAAPGGKTERKPPVILLDCKEYYEASGTGKKNSWQKGEAETGAVTAAREEAEKAAERVPLTCPAACGTLQITVSIGTPTAPIGPGAGGHKEFLGTCDWKLIAECV